MKIFKILVYLLAFMMCVIIIKRVYKFLLMEGNVKLIISSSNEDCDTYDCIWKIDSVLVGNPNLKGKDIWLQNSKLDYEEDSFKVYYSVLGDYTWITIGSDFIGCRPTYEFNDLIIKKIDSSFVSR